MNHIYRTLWNAASGTWTAVSELARGRGTSVRGIAAAGLWLLAVMTAAQAGTTTYTDGQNNAAAIGTTAVDPATLSIASGTATQSGGISGAGTVTKTGAGTLVLTGPVAHTGSTLISQGGLRLSSASSQSVGSRITARGALGLQATNGATLSFAGLPQYVGGGGALVVENSASLTIGTDGSAGAAVVFSGNSSFGGGAIYLYRAGVVTVSDTRFSNNTSAGASGALHYSGATSLTLTRTAFDNNTSAGHGGVMQIDDQAGSLTIVDSSFSGNSSVGVGGAIYRSNPNFTSISGSTFSGNSSGNYGGALAFDLGSFSISGSSFEGNSAQGQGGAIMYYDRTYTISDSRFSGNSANGGGALYGWGQGNLTVQNTTFEQNTSTSSGGALSTGQGGTTTVLGSTFSDNTARSGGAIFNNGNSVTTVTGGTFTGNAAATGGAVYNAGSGTITLTDSSFTGNRATTLNSSDSGSGPGYVYASTSSTGGGAAVVGYTGSTTRLRVSAASTTLYAGNLADGQASSLAFITGTLSSSVTDGNVWMSVDRGTTQLEIDTGNAGTLDMRDPMGIASDVYTSTSSSDLGGGVTSESSYEQRSGHLGTLRINKDGAGTWKLGGDNHFGVMSATVPDIDPFTGQPTGGSTSYEGRTQFAVSAGTLYLYAGAEVANAANPVVAGGLRLDGADSSFLLGSGATLVAAGNNTIASGGTITLADGAIVSGGAGRGATSLTLSAPGGVDLQGAIQARAPASTDTFTLNADLGGSGSVVKTGAGVLRLTGNNTYSAGTALKQGTLEVATSTALGIGELAMDDGTTLRMVADGLTLGNDIRMTGNNDPVIDTGAFNATLAGAISGGGFLTKEGTGVLTLTGANTYTGATQVATGTLRAGVAATFSAASAHGVAAGATLDLAGFGQTIASMTNAGTVSLVGAAAGTTLTVQGPWVGNGGVLRLGTALGDSASPTDRVILDGATAVASGTTHVQIVNLGGLGALTTGNGIEIVGTANGASITAGAFDLAGTVSAGAYDYHLNTTAQGAYLQSTLGATPTYRAEAPLFAALPEQFRQAGLAMLGNHHLRLGDDRPVTSKPSAGPVERQAWARVLNVARDINQPGTVSPRSTGRFAGFQAGTDVWNSGPWRAGVYVGQLDGDQQVRGFARGIQAYAAGYNDLRSQFVGAYATWQDDSGRYVDSVVQAGRLRYGVRPSMAAGTDGRGTSWLASIEAGRTLALSGSWQLEPQVQLISQRVDLEDVEIPGAFVQQRPGSSWVLRMGARLRGTVSTPRGEVQPYGRLNVYRSAGGSDLARFATSTTSTAVTTRGDGTSVELAAGATWQVSPTVNVYGEFGRLGSAGGPSQARGRLSGSIGLRVVW